MADDTQREELLPALVTDGAIIGGLTKAEIDVQIGTAHRWPRNLTTVHRGIETMATLDLNTSMSCRFMKPQREKDRETNKWVDTFIEGPSVRFAEITLCNWGNARVATRRTDLTETDIEATGIFHDLESNVAIAMSVRRGIIGTNGNRFPNHVIDNLSNALASIALRNAILRGVPRAVWGRGYQRALDTIKGDSSTLVSRRAEMLKMFTEAGVKAEQVYEILGVKGRDDIDIDLLFQAAGYLSAIRDGETTLDQLLAFRREGEAADKPGLDAAFGAKGPTPTGEKAGGRKKTAPPAAEAKPTPDSATAASGDSAAATSGQKEPAATSSAGPTDIVGKGLVEAVERVAGAAAIAEAAETGDLTNAQEETVTAEPTDNVVQLNAGGGEAAADAAVERKADDEKADQEVFLSVFNPYADKVEAANSWLSIKPALLTFWRAPEFSRAPAVIQQSALSRAYVRAIKIGDPVAPDTDPVFFRIWLRQDRSVGDHEGPEAVFRRLCRTKAYQATSDAEKDIIGDEIEELGK